MIIKLPKYPALEFRQYQVGDRIPDPGSTVDVWRKANNNAKEEAVVVLTQWGGLTSVFWKMTANGKQIEAAKTDFWRPSRESFFGSTTSKQTTTAS